MHTSEGSLRYSTNDGKYKLIVEVDPSITSYYMSLVPKFYHLKMQRYAPHISVIRNEIPATLSNWGKHEGEVVQFDYEGDIKNDEIYFWLPVYSRRLNDIRIELGLNMTSQFSRPPDGSDCFHTTMGNIKSL